MKPEERIHQLGLSLPEATVPIANYVSTRKAGNLLFVSGQGPRLPNGSFKVGVVGRDLSVEEAYEDARLAGLNLLAAVKAVVGSLSAVTAVVKVLGMVNAVPEFRDHPRVINGCSDLLVEVFGDVGKHARSAVGMGSLPNNMTVEIEAIFEIAED